VVEVEELVDGEVVVLEATEAELDELVEDTVELDDDELGEDEVED